jgi:hypothetical protein
MEGEGERRFDRRRFLSTVGVGAGALALNPGNVVAAPKRAHASARPSTSRRCLSRACTPHAEATGPSPANLRGGDDKPVAVRRRHPHPCTSTCSTTRCSTTRSRRSSRARALRSRTSSSRKRRKPASRLRSGAAGPGGPAGLQNRSGVATPRWVGSTPAPLRAHRAVTTASHRPTVSRAFGRTGVAEGDAQRSDQEGDTCEKTSDRRCSRRVGRVFRGRRRGRVDTGRGRPPDQ